MTDQSPFPKLDTTRKLFHAAHAQSTTVGQWLAAFIKLGGWPGLELSDVVALCDHYGLKQLRNLPRPPSAADVARDNARSARFEARHRRSQGRLAAFAFAVLWNNSDSDE